MKVSTKKVVVNIYELKKKHYYDPLDDLLLRIMLDGEMDRVKRLSFAGTVKEEVRYKDIPIASFDWYFEKNAVVVKCYVMPPDLFPRIQ